MIDLLKGSGLVLGMVGAVFVASSSPLIRGLGFGAWIIGNTAWVIVGMITDDPYLWGLFGFYLITAFIGLRVALRAI